MVFDKKICLDYKIIWLPCQPELYMELNSLNKFSRDLCKEHPCTVSTILGQVFKEKKLFKEIVDARPHGRTNHGRRTTGHHQSLP